MLLKWFVLYQNKVKNLGVYLIPKYCLLFALGIGNKCSVFIENFVRVKLPPFLQPFIIIHHSINLFYFSHSIFVFFFIFLICLFFSFMSFSLFILSQTHKGYAYGIDLGVDENLVQDNMMKFQDKWCCGVTGCTSKTLYKRDMRRHVYSHLGLKPFQCIICSVRMNQQRRLLSHFLLSHQ